MIITRSWLDGFIDLSGVSDDTLYETFNAIGLEVDSVEKIVIPKNVVIGKIISCEKHPDADKLNVCQVDIGGSTRQIVCGAANVVNAEYVAVATVGAVLPGNFEIKHAKLRGVDSEGMICSSGEIGLPEMGKGIMILDDSIGKLEAGKELNDYKRVADTIIELELTANRGDCLCVRGVARDLGSALNLETREFDYKADDTVRLGISRDMVVRTRGENSVDVYYEVATIEQIESHFLIGLRLAMVGVDAKGKLEAFIAYATHVTGVILRAYDIALLRNEESKIALEIIENEKGLAEITHHSHTISVVGSSQDEKMKATDSSKEILFEASYIDPDTLVEAAHKASIETDDLYYKTSRGSNPDLEYGLKFLSSMLDKFTDIKYHDGCLKSTIERESKVIGVDAEEIASIVGMKIDIGRITTILKKLGFSIAAMGDGVVAATVPNFRHDIKNIQDISEEIVRIVGINNIDSKPLSFVEKNYINSTSNRYKIKKLFRYNAVGAGFFENVSYVFTDKTLLEKYGFDVLEEKLDLSNPIAEDLNTLRSTILLNLLNAAQRNTNYSTKSIPLFEIGAVFDKNREEQERMSFIFSGQESGENVSNAGKPSQIDFAGFVKKVGSVLGSFTLEPCSYNNALIHPYQSANVLIDGKVCGFISKLHPVVQEAYSIPETFIAEFDFDALMPKHINAEAISKFQGVYKDLSVVIDKGVLYGDVAKTIDGVDAPMLKKCYPIDVYEDEKLGEKKSLTVRFFIQSLDKTLEDSDIEKIMESVMLALESQHDAKLR